MSRTLTGAQDLVLDASTDRAVYLYQLGLDPELFFSSGVQITHAGDVYLAGRVRPGANAEAGFTRMGGSFTLLGGYSDAQIARFQTEDPVGADFSVYKVLIRPDGTFPDPVLQFVGVISSYSIGELRCEVSYSMEDLATAFAPPRMCSTAYGFDYGPRDGEVLVWQGEKTVFEVR